jgi:serine/threonine protein kinase
MSQAFFTDPLGSWPSDVCDILLECTTLSASPNSYIDEELVIKSILKANSGDVQVNKERLGREVDMTFLAGNDCAIPIVSRYFSHGVICGFITRFGKCITQGPTEDIRPEYHECRLSVIQQFCLLLDRLHSKGIIHGDVKPSNLIFDATGNLRFIDFAEVVLESEPRADAPQQRATPHLLP